MTSLLRKNSLVNRIVQKVPIPSIPNIKKLDIGVSSPRSSTSKERSGDTSMSSTATAVDRDTGEETTTRKDSGGEESDLEGVETEETNETVTSSLPELSTYPDITKNPLDKVAATAALLGIVFGFGCASMFFVQLKTGSVYLMALALFHFLEFWVTARYNPTRVHSESFIINNGSAYTLAHTIALIEFSIEYAMFPNFKRGNCLTKVVGFALMIMGQSVRTLAMKTAGRSFNHLVQTKRQSDHKLITNGIYEYIRHPSYFGFFWWAVGTQLMLVNPLGVVGFAITLYTFFSDRIEQEEKFLVSFFGKSYVEYKSKTPVYIPFIN